MFTKWIQGISILTHKNRCKNTKKADTTQMCFCVNSDFCGNVELEHWELEHVELEHKNLSISELEHKRT
jgi:hypothetical protein